MTHCNVERDGGYTKVLVVHQSGASNGGGERHDFVELGHAHNHIVSATAFTDVGIPLLQVQPFQFDDQRSVDSILEELQDRQPELEACLCALAMSALSILSNLPMIAESEAFQADEEAQVQSDLLLQFMQQSGTGHSLALPDVASIKANHLIVSNEIETAARQCGVFQREAIDLLPAFSVSVVGNAAASALDTFRYMQRVERRTGHRFSEGLASIDVQLAKQALVSVRNPSPASVCYYGDGKSEFRRYRLQAARAYPMLASYLVEFEASRQAIDRGLPLLPVVQKLTGLSSGKLKRLARISLANQDELHTEDENWPLRDNVGLEDNRQRRYRVGSEPAEAQLLHILNQLETSWIPDNGHDWLHFVDIVSTVVIPFGAKFDIDHITLLAPAGGHWKAFQSSLAAAAQLPPEGFGRRHMAHAASDAFEAIDSFAMTVLIPRILNAILSTGEPCPPLTPGTLNRAALVSFALLRGKARNPAGRLLEFGRRWLPRVQALTVAAQLDAQPEAPEEERPARQPGDGWPMLAEDFRASSGLVVRNLTTPAQLSIESNRLDHCVGRLYVQSAKSGRCHIFSVQDASGGKSLSTFEVSPPVSDNPKAAAAILQIVQHKGRGNAKPSARAAAACREWMQACRSEKHALNLEEVLAWREMSRARSSRNRCIDGELSPKEAWKQVLGAQWNEQDTLDAVWQEWRKHILRRPYAAGTDSGIVFRSPEARELLRRWSPAAARALVRSS
ncbi:MAG: PcfJ domain-containing protein [Rhodobacteraceae bacterium]|nr:PcfJ domain-containing protein [Paracoccaceae bacterium]